MTRAEIYKTVADHRAAGVIIISHCSAYPADHSHQVDLAAKDQDAEIDVAWKLQQLCPICGSLGGGLTLKVGKK
jgi:hypothetical protein